MTSYCSALERGVRFRRVLDLLLFGAPGAPPESRQLTAERYRAWLTTFEAVLTDARDCGDLRRGVAPGDAARALLVVTVGVMTTTLHAPGLVSPSDAYRATA